MPSGKQAKAARRNARTAPPPVQSKGGPRRARQASPRALAIGGGAIALIAVAVVLAVVLGGGKGSSGIPAGTPTIGSVDSGLPGAADVASQYKGIPQTGTTLGWPFAPVTLTEYIDLQCPVCREYETTVFPDILSKYVRTKKVKIVVKPWAFIGPDSFKGQDAMLAAALQNRAFNFAQVLYDNQGTENTGWLTDSMLAQIAASVPGLNVPKLFADRKTATVKSQVSSVAADVSANKVNETPTLFVGKSGTRGTHVLMNGGGDEAAVVKALDDALSS